MSEIEELKKRITTLEAALMANKSSDYDVIVIRKPEPLPPRKFVGYWNLYRSKGFCHAHVHTSLRAADNAAYTRHRVDCLRVEWEEGQTEGRWISVINGEPA